MMKMAQRLTTGLMQAWNLLRGSFGGLRTIVWAVSYWPWIAALLVGVPVAFMPALFDLAAWVYAFSLPFGFAAGVLGYLGAYMMLDE